MKSYKDAGVLNTVKVVHIPKEMNLIHVRLENLGDLYDTDSQLHTVDLSKIADAIWVSANQLSPKAYD